MFLGRVMKKYMLFKPNKIQGDTLQIRFFHMPCHEGAAGYAAVLLQSREAAS